MPGRLATPPRTRRPHTRIARGGLRLVAAALLAASATLSSPVAAQATQRLTFESLAGLDPANGINYVSNCYVEQGVRVALTTLPCGTEAAFGVYASSSPLGYTNSAALFNNLTSTVSFTPVAGGPFALTSIDLAPILLGSFAANPINVMFTGFLTGGGTIVQMVTIPAGAAGLTTYALNGFTNLTGAQFVVTSPSFEPYVQFDNVNVSVVPEPATMTLLGSGLVGLAGFARRRRAARAA